jgi:hypothetical protein
MRTRRPISFKDRFGSVDPIRNSGRPLTGDTHERLDIVRSEMLEPTNAVKCYFGEWRDIVRSTGRRWFE